MAEGLDAIAEALEVARYTAAANAQIARDKAAYEAALRESYNPGAGPSAATWGQPDPSHRPEYGPQRAEGRRPSAPQNKVIAARTASGPSRKASGPSRKAKPTPPNSGPQRPERPLDQETSGTYPPETRVGGVILRQKFKPSAPAADVDTAPLRAMGPPPPFPARVQAPVPNGPPLPPGAQDELPGQSAMAAALERERARRALQAAMAAHGQSELDRGGFTGLPPEVPDVYDEALAAAGQASGVPQFRDPIADAFRTLLGALALGGLSPAPQLDQRWPVSPEPGPWAGRVTGGAASLPPPVHDPGPWAGRVTGGRSGPRDGR